MIILMINIPSVGFGGALIKEIGASMTLFFLILIGLIAPVFYWITVHFLSVDSLNQKN